MLTNVLIQDMIDEAEYIATSPEDCKNDTDRTAYEECVRLNRGINIGSVVAVPIREFMEEDIEE